MKDVTKPEVSQTMTYYVTRFDISGANVWVELKIDQEVARGVESYSSKFHNYNYWGCGENWNFMLAYALLSKLLMVTISSIMIEATTSTWRHHCHCGFMQAFSWDYRTLYIEVEL